MKSNKVGTPTTEEELKEEAIRNTVQVESLAKLKESFGEVRKDSHFCTPETSGSA